MAIRSNNRQADKTEAVKTGSCCPVNCMNCLHAMLMQYGRHDPVLADCTKQPQPGNDRFPYVREVAGVPRRCAMHTWQNEAEKTIQQRVKVNRWTGHVYNDWDDREAV